MSTIRSGRAAPDVTLHDLDGRSHRLSDYWGDGRFANGRFANGRSLLVIFLRHLA